jgi:hypothetical protein
MTKEQLLRKKLSERAEASERAEGLQVSKNTLEATDNYIAGKADLKDIAKKIETRYGIK